MSDVRISGASTAARTEADIRLNYGDPSKIIAAANDSGTGAEAMFFSTDGGSTWGQSTLPLATNAAGAPVDALQSDPAVDWTSDGTARALCIGIGAGGVNTRVRAYQSVDFGATWTLEATPSGTQTAADREIIWVDHSPTSPFKDQVYATWHNGTPVFFARRTAGAGGTWQPAIQLSGAETTGLGIGGDIKTNSVGDLFVFWPDADGSRNIVVTKSTDGGVTFAAPVVIATTFATTRRLSVPADSGRKARIYISAGAYRTGTKDLVYAVWADLSGAAGCNTGGGPGTNVASACKTRTWLSRSTDGGATWQPPRMINDQSSTNDQFHPKLCVDETNGDLVIIYYDTVADSGRLKTDVWMQSSFDDGESWTEAVKLTSAQTDETSAGANSNQYGDYTGLSGYAGTFFPAWTDRRGGAKEEIWTSPIALPNRFLPMAPVAALHRTPDYMDIFAVCESGEVASAWWNGNPWRPWFRLFSKRFPALVAPVAAVSRNSNQMDLFAVQNGQIWNCWFTGTWNDWFALPASPTVLPEAPALDAYGLAALSRDPNFMDLFIVDVKGEAWSIYWNGNPWRKENWFPMGEKLSPPGGPIRFRAGAPIAALSRHQNHMELFIAGQDNQLWSNFFDGNGWSGWFQPLPPSQVLRPMARMSAISRNKNQMDLFAISPQDGQIYNAWWTGGSGWHDWFQLPSLPFSANPKSMSFPPFGFVAANTRDPNFMDVFAVDHNGDVRLIWWNGTWTSLHWGTLGGKKFPPGAPITAISRNSNQMDLFIVSDDHRLWSTWFTGAWSGIWFEVK